MALDGVNITLNIQNNTDYPQEINIMGNPSDLLDTVNATTEYRWDVSAFSFTNEDSVTIQYKPNVSATFSVFTAALQGDNLTSVVYALNELGIGYFNLYTVLGVTYIGTYNQNYIFGDMNIYSSTTPVRGINSNFISGTGFPPDVYQVASDSFGNIFAVGATSLYNGTAIHNIAKINSVGILDAAFNTNAKVVIPFGDIIQDVILQPDGKVILGCAGGVSNYLIRLNTDGTNDATFVTGTNFDGNDYSLFLQADSKILVGGIFTNYDGNSCNGLARINSDGSFDATLNIGTGFNDSNSGSTGVNVVYEQPDGKILVGGTFDSYNGSPAHGIIRLNSDGTVDGTFNIGTGINTISDTINTIAIQAPDKILLGGRFPSFNSTSANNIIMLNADGSIDGAFVYGTGFDSTVNSIVIQTDAKILVGGAFSLYNGVSYLNIVRLNTNGSVDTAWSIGGFNSDVSAMTISSNTVICVGGFTSFNGTPQIRISDLYI